MTATIALTIAVLALTLLWIYTVTAALLYIRDMRHRLVRAALPEAAELLADASRHGRHTAEEN